MSVTDQVSTVVTAVVHPLRLLVDSVSVTPAGKRRVVRIAVDRVVAEDRPTTEPTPALSLDEIADATREISAALDDTDVLGNTPYTLEVSSPGVDRPLQLPRHYRRNVGRLLRASTQDGEVTGRVTSADADGVTLTTPKGAVTLPYADITRAVVQVEFTRPGADGLPDAPDDNDDTDDYDEEGA